MREQRERAGQELERFNAARSKGVWNLADGIFEVNHVRALRPKQPSSFTIAGSLAGAIGPEAGQPEQRAAGG